MDLSKSYFDKQLSRFLKETATKKDLMQLEIRSNSKFDKLTDRIDKLTDTVDKLAASVSRGFQTQQEYMDDHFAEMRAELDVRSQVHTLQKRIEKLEAHQSASR